MATEIDQTITKIDKVLRERGSAYSCKRVSWEDCSRGTSGGQLSSLGSNITDVRLTARDGRVLYTVRTDNFNEKTGRVDARAVGLLDADGAPTTLREVLRRAGEHGAAVGLDPSTDLLDEDLDDEVGIRFQTTFLPLDDAPTASAAQSDAAPAKLEFCSENHNYQTTSDDDPRNLLVLGTTQGLAIQQDGRGCCRIFHHERDPSTGSVGRYWRAAALRL